MNRNNPLISRRARKYEVIRGTSLTAQQMRTNHVAGTFVPTAYLASISKRHDLGRELAWHQMAGPGFDCYSRTGRPALYRIHYDRQWHRLTI